VIPCDSCVPRSHVLSVVRARVDLLCCLCIGMLRSATVRLAASTIISRPSSYRSRRPITNTRPTTPPHDTTTSIRLTAHHNVPRIDPRIYSGCPALRFYLSFHLVRCRSSIVHLPCAVRHVLSSSKLDVPSSYVRHVTCKNTLYFNRSSSCRFACMSNARLHAVPIAGASWNYNFRIPF
jgi:hypothetical protein